MKNLKSKLFYSYLIFLIVGCQTVQTFDIQTFHDKDATGDLHVISVKSDRVKQKCLFFNAEAENNWRHQYLMYLLNDKNEVLEIMQPTHQDRESCYSQINKVERILKSESVVRLCVREELRKKTEDPKDLIEMVQFGSLGDHKIIYESQTLDSVCNSKKCESNNEVFTSTCPGFVKHELSK